MELQKLFSIISAILASLGGGALIVFALSKWLGGIWAERIINNEKALINQNTSDRTRKIEALMKHYEKQMEELYGPLFNMVHQIFVANQIEGELINGNSVGSHSTDIIEQIKGYFQEKYYRPHHEEIASIMKSKLYLVEDAKIPKSFYHYLQHAAQERDQKYLWNHHNIDSSFMAGEPWPSKFYEDIKDGFDNSRRNYQKCLDGLKT